MNLQRNDRFTLVEALDRLIDKGVSVSGDLSISVADIDLVYVGLRVLLASAEDVPALRTMRSAAALESNPATSPDALPAHDSVSPPEEVLPRTPQAEAQSLSAAKQARSRDVIDVEESSAAKPQRLLDIDPEQIERDLCRLVLTVVELLRQLMEKQAIRRMEGGSLDDAEVERLGTAFERLDAKMQELKAVFGLESEDLNLDLGPLGTLV